MEYLTSAKNIGFVQKLLQWSLALLAIVTGVDKFFNFLVYWPQYVPLSLHRFDAQIPFVLWMYVPGIIEIIFGLFVLFRPKAGGYLLALMFVVIVLTLLVDHSYYNVALIDTMIAVSCIALARLSKTPD